MGVNVGPHDSSAALLRDGELTAMIEQERLSRRRRAMHESPRDAIAACLDQEGIGLGAVAEVAVGWDVPALVATMQAEPFDETRLAERLLGGLDASRQQPPVRYVEHHTAHAASAFYLSGFSEAAILVVDGRGETVATTVAVGGPNGIETIETWGLDQSLGHLYGTAADWAGLTEWGAGKLMGLASYGRAHQYVPLRPEPNGYAIECAPPADTPVRRRLGELRAQLRAGFEKWNYPFQRGCAPDAMAYADFAASVQAALEQALLRLAEVARAETGCRNLVLAGGVGMNCTANGMLIRSGLFDEVWIPPFPHDAGVSIGAALARERSDRAAPPPSRLDHAFWTPSTPEPDDSLLAELSECEVSRITDPQLAESVAEHLEAGKLVGWWQGRAEVGQRALGARSILCDPRKREALVRANQVKGRESWRPLAPAVLQEHADDLFDGPLPAAANFMLAAWPVREEAQRQVTAAVHVDGSARPQVVRSRQTRYHNLISAFHDRTGVPTLINTSFNLAGEPIVHSAKDAIQTFLRSDLDVLVLADLIATKPSTEVRCGS